MRCARVKAALFLCNSDHSGVGLYKMGSGGGVCPLRCFWPSGVHGASHLFCLALTLAHRALCAAAIFARALADILRRWRFGLDV